MTFEEQVERLFTAALEQPEPERTAFLEHTEGYDPQIVAEVASLLEHAAGHAAQPLDVHAPELPRASFRPGDRIDDYRIVGLIGQGGTAEVYHATQCAPVRREVALKIIRPGLLSRQLVARFRSEQQVLASLSHRSIAAVFDGGTTRCGRPYFSMELVEGEQLMEFCDGRRLSVRERLRLFLGICAGLEHAHQRAVIHRDLKPSNVLVAIRDGLPVPVVIDFGIAKPIEDDNPGVPLTETGQLVATLEYASPEQAGFTRVAPDTRTDVYGLGLLLNELLMGGLPHGRRSGREAFFDTLRRIRTDDPSPPSRQLMAAGAASHEAARLRRTDVRGLARLLRGDLDAIALRALERAPKHRYPSVAALSDDIRRFLGNEPVAARTVGPISRAAKLLRRHALPSALIAVATLLLLGFSTSTWIQARRVVAERDRANEATSYLMRFFEGWLSPSDLAAPATATDRPTLDRRYLRQHLTEHQQQLLHRAAGSMATIEDAQLRRNVQESIGRIYASAGLFDEAIVIFENLLASMRGTPSPDSRARLLGTLGELYLEAGDPARAREYSREALDLWRQQPERYRKERATERRRLAMADSASAEWASATLHLEHAVDLWTEEYGEGNLEVAARLDDLARVMFAAGEPDRAIRHLERALSIWENGMGGDYAQTALDRFLIRVHADDLTSIGTWIDTLRNSDMSSYLMWKDPLLLFQHPGLARAHETPEFQQFTEEFVRRAGLGNPPEIEILSPFEGDEVRVGERVSVAFNAAADPTLRDVRVSSNFGFSRRFTSPPYRTSFIVPTSGASLELTVRVRSGQWNAVQKRLRLRVHPKAELPTNNNHASRTRPASGLQTLRVPYWPARLAVGDVDNDGAPDLVVSHHRSRLVTVLVNQGDCTFEQFEVTPDPLADSLALGLADMDRNGLLDIIAASSGFGDRVSVSYGRGDGTFEQATGISLGINHTHLAVEDFNRDGFPDALVESGFRYPTMLIHGSRAGLSGLVEPVGTIKDALVGDLNGDGWPDYAGVSEHIEVVFNNRRGGFEPPVALPRLWPGAALRGIADIDGDGAQDLIVTSFEVENDARNFVVAILLGDGHGSFSESARQPILRVPDAPFFGSQSGSGIISIGDLDGNSTQDLVHTDGAALVLFSADRSGGLDSGARYSLPLVATAPAAIADFDVDGWVDMVVFGKDGSMAVFFGAEDGSLRGLERAQLSGG